MKKYLLGLLFPMLLLTTAFEGPFQGDADLVVAALKSGNPAEIAKHFAVVVDLKFLTAPEDKIVASEKAAEKLAAFYTEYKIKGFERTAQREIGNTMYLTGKISGAEKNYNITLMLMKKNGAPYHIVTLRVN
ncbi:MAG: hypothetical protein RL372_1120 [Bacteroidota bacterium]|jgi:hypothetical protein